MLPPLVQCAGRNGARQPRERGVTLLLVALAMFSIIAMAALSVDVGTLYQASAEAQRAADAAALAGARAISMSGITGAATPTIDPVSWQQICGATSGGTSSVATGSAVAIAQQNRIGGIPLSVSSVNVTYSAGVDAVSSGVSDCSALDAKFGVNPVVTVKVTQSGLSTYFSRIWGRTGSSVSATASAEAFNPSNSKNATGDLVPVQPRCVKPWILPNLDPAGNTCTYSTCPHFVDPTTGAIINPGILAQGPGVIGESFWISPDCTGTGSCAPATVPPQITAGRGGGGAGGGGIPHIQYLPGNTSFPSVAVPADGTDACSASTTNYAQAIAGCDQSTKYECGKAGQNEVDLSENPVVDTPNGTRCLIHQGRLGGGAPSGQDILQLPGANPPSYPFEIQVGSNNPLLGAGAGKNDLVTSSSSIVSLPLYDTANTINQYGTTSVTVVGFLQVFIDRVNAAGEVRVTVMNVSGCGNAATGTALTGTSPVPVRLITPQ